VYFKYPPEANAVFVSMPLALSDFLETKYRGLGEWELDGKDNVVVRLMTSHSTTEEKVRTFVQWIASWKTQAKAKL
jgi:threonine aldolase